MPRRTGKEGLHGRVRQGEVLRQKHERARRKAQEQKEFETDEILP